MTNDELKAEMADQTTKLGKIATETRTLLTKIDELETAIGNAGSDVPAAVQDAWAGLKAQTDVVDGLVPDNA